MLLDELGFPAIAFNSEQIPTRGENGKFVRSIIEHLRSRFDRVVFFMDNDEAGKAASIALKKEYKLPYVVTPEGEPKDISDYYAKYGKRKTRQLINKLIKKLIANEISFEDIVAGNSKSDGFS